MGGADGFVELDIGGAFGLGAGVEVVREEAGEEEGMVGELGSEVELVVWGGLIDFEEVV